METLRPLCSFLLSRCVFLNLLTHRRRLCCESARVPDLHLCCRIFVSVSLNPLLPRAPALDPAAPFFFAKCAAGGRSARRDETPLGNWQGERFQTPAAPPFLASAGACSPSSDKIRDQRFARRDDDRRGNRGGATSWSGPDCFCRSNDTAESFPVV